MRKTALILALLLPLLSIPFEASAQMSDKQVVAYITEAALSGKTEAQIANELLSKGVSTPQISRLIQEYRSKASSATTESVKSIKNTEDTKRKDQLDVDKENPVKEKDKETTKLSPEEDTLLPIWGHDIFNNPMLTFEPNDNAATPEDYVLGPGDQVIIDVYGVNEANITQTISPEGKITVSQVGPISLSGLTIKQATSKISKSLSKIYSSIGGGSKVSVSLGKVRTIQVNILGEVQVPGTYRLSSFTTAFNAIYRAGGVTDIGSLRQIKVSRGGEQIATVDLYSYLFNGSTEQNISLKEGDVIIVPAYEAVVTADGGVRRPMRYEMKPGDGVDALIRYAGGLTGDADASNVLVERHVGPQSEAYTVAEADFSTFQFKDLDVVTVSSNKPEFFANEVEIQGSVYRPGKFALGGDVATVRQLVEKAGGLTETAFKDRAQIVREKADRTLEVLAVPIGAVMSGTKEDVVLRRGDILTISDIQDVEQKGEFTIVGLVNNPGTFEYAEKTTVEDLIMLAGGLVEGASLLNVEVSRQLFDPSSTTAPVHTTKIITLTIDDGMVVNPKSTFYLEPNDIVAVRRNPSFTEPQTVNISGEVNFPGQYVLTGDNDRISDLIARAGGVTPRGNLRGGMLKRKTNEYERAVHEAIHTLAEQSSAKDTIDTKKIEIEDYYSVGVEMDNAVNNPRSDYNIVLRDGDEIIIPAASQTVTIKGEVLYPNTVQYISGKSAVYYINQAGGVTNDARKSKVYVVYMNGTAKSGLGSRIEPGCEVIVPQKQQRQRMSSGEWLAIGTSAASIASMVATIVSLILNSK